MADDNNADWERFADAYERGAPPSTSVVRFGADVATEADLRILGDVAGKRVLELGCGGGHASVAFAHQGATAIAVDSSAAQLSAARRLCEKEEVRVELHQGDLADLAFVRADSIDLVFSTYAFSFVEDLNRVFRQVHRVLRENAPLTFAIPHPAYAMVADDDPDQPLRVRRSYFDRTPRAGAIGDVTFKTYHRTIAELYMGLVRSGFRIDLLLEPEPTAGAPRSGLWRDALRFVPGTLIVRARKEGL